MSKSAPFENLGVIDPAFDGCSLYRGFLWTPENLKFTVGDINAIPAERELIRCLTSQLAGLDPKNSARRAAEVRRQLTEIERIAARLAAQVRS